MDPSVWEWVGGEGISTVSEWGLICGDEYKVGLAQSAFFVGAFMGKLSSLTHSRYECPGRSDCYCKSGEE